MNASAHAIVARSSPALRYRNVGFAVSWLCAAFGFEEHSLVVDAHGRSSYAELSFENTIIMLGATDGFEVDNLMRQPDEIGGAETQGSYYFIRDIDSHYARAREAGAKIVLDLKTHANGTQGYTCRDPEGHLWTFGTYDPWGRLFDSEPVSSYTKVAASLGRDQTDGDGTPTYVLKRLGAGLSILGVILGIGLAWVYGPARQTSREAVAAPKVIMYAGSINKIANEQAQRSVAEARRLIAFQRAARRIAERASLAAGEEALRERGLRASAERMAHELAERLGRVEQTNALAVSVASTARQQLAEERSIAAEKARLIELALADERSAKEQSARIAFVARDGQVAAEKALRQTRARLVFVSDGARKSTRDALEDMDRRVASEQAARAAAEQSTRQAREELARERTSKESALQIVMQLKKQLASLNDHHPGRAEKARRTSLTATSKARKAVLPRKSAKRKVPTATEDGWYISRDLPY
jgi:uncharacterized glyoxalase superfamily protein PhnB